MSKSRMVDPGHGYRAHTQVHKAKHKYIREKEKRKIEKEIKEEE